MRPPSRHAAFFSSLKQVEMRLASEDKTSRNKNNNGGPSQNHLSSPSSATDTLTPQIHLHSHQPSCTSTSTLQDSDPPQEFLSHSLEFPPTTKEPAHAIAPQKTQFNESANSEGGDIDRLMGLLGLSECREKLVEDDGSCFSDRGFYGKIAGVKGPKSEKEARRLEGWIGYFLNDGGEKREPLRLAHLLLGKAALLHSDEFEGVEFPQTVEEFLENDPPNEGNTAYV